MFGRDNGTRRSWFKAILVSILFRDERRLSPQLRERVLKWMRRSSQHLGHLLRAERFIRYMAGQKLVDRAPQLSTLTPRPSGMSASPWRPVLTVGAAAVVLLLALRISSPQEDSEPIRHLTLPDGSVAHVLRGSDFQVDFSPDVRMINLPHGEAVFEVAKDADRPFVVRSQASDTIAVGTRFGVDATLRDTTTTVSEGEVLVVAPAGADRTTGTPVHAGEALRVTAGAPRPQSALAVNAERRISWAAGWLAFEGETAGEAVNAFNRFINVRIEITQSELSNKRLKYGRFELDKPGGFAHAVGAALNAPVTLDPKRNVIYIGERPKPEQSHRAP
jgi:transmembrane sensor